MSIAGGPGRPRTPSDVIVLTDERHLTKCFNKWLLKLTAHAFQDFVGLAPRHCRLIGPPLDQGAENIANSQDPDDVIDKVAGKFIRIATAV